MELLKLYHPNEMGMFKIIHKKYNNFKTIGTIIEENPDLNICKIIFKDINGKTRKYWFHLFTGSVVTLPKKEGNWAEDVDPKSEKAYSLSVERINSYEINEIEN